MTHTEDNEVDDSDKDDDSDVFFDGNWFGASRQSKSDSTSSIFDVVRHMFGIEWTYQIEPWYAYMY